MVNMQPARLDVGVFELGEGPAWDAERGILSWVDITPGRLHTLDLASAMHSVYDCGQPTGAAVPRASGGYVCALRDGVMVADPGSPPSRWVAKGFVTPTHRLNDGACDAAGRFWVGATAMEFGSRPGALFCVEPDGGVRNVLNSVQFSNGIGFTSDGATMYLIDSLAHVLLAYDIDSGNGELSNARRVTTFDPTDGTPDGLALDAEGGIWVARYGAGSLERYTAAGVLSERIACAATQPTCPAFGGADLRTLYLTSAWQFMEADSRDADQGALFALDVGVAGDTTFAFGG